MAMTIVIEASYLQSLSEWRTLSKSVLNSIT